MPESVNLLEQLTAALPDDPSFDDLFDAVCQIMPGRPTQDTVCHYIALVIARRSKQPHVKLVAVFVRDGKILTTGYNGLPAGVNDDPATGRWNDKNRNMTVVHAEMNGVANAALHGISLKGATVLVPWIPCSRCTGMLIGAGITEVVVTTDDENFGITDDWVMRYRMSMAFFKEVGIKVRRRDNDENVTDEIIAILESWEFPPGYTHVQGKQ